MGVDFTEFCKAMYIKKPLPSHMRNWLNQTTLSAFPAKSVRAMPNRNGYNHGRFPIASLVSRPNNHSPAARYVTESFAHQKYLSGWSMLTLLPSRPVR